MRTYILASRSPRRKELLEEMGTPQPQAAP